MEKLLSMFSFFKKTTNIKSGLSLKPRRYFVRDLLIVAGVVLVWRGIWHLADRFLFPDYPLLSEALSILIGLFLLYLPDRDLSHLTGETHHHIYHHADQKEGTPYHHEESLDKK